VLTTRTWVLLIVAALFTAAGVLNFAQRATEKFPPTDGITWIQTPQGIIAQRVERDQAGARAGIIPGDRLIGISQDETNFETVTNASEVQIFLEETGVGGHLTYYYERPSNPPETRFYYASLYNLESKPRWTEYDLYLNFIGLVYLLIGFFVLFKQGGRAPFVLHFASVCLVAFVFHFYKPLGTFEDLDLAIAFLDDAALILFAPLFLHFCAIYPTRHNLSSKRRWLAVLIYLPAFFLLAVSAVTYFAPPSRLERFGINESFDLVGRYGKAVFVHFWLSLAVGTSLLVWRFFKSKSAVARQQLKWVMSGALIAVTPLTLLYGINHVLELESERWVTDVAILPLILIPLAFGHSVVRYRLMDVDIVVRRAVVYAISTLAIALLIGGVVWGAGVYALGDAVTPGEITLRVIIAVVAMAVIVMIAAPIKNFLQERADRYFYGETYDMRQGLMDFGRTLSATTALEPLLTALISRLQQVLSVNRIAIFIEDASAASGYRVARAAGLSAAVIVPPDFREMIRRRSAETGVVRADDLDLMPETTGFVRRALHYYVPCVVRGRMVAVIGLGRSADGALLSSEDVEILRTVSGYVAVAIENSLLYQEQEERAAELEMLKEFNESIVESVNIGLLAVDLEGRVTRCNSSLEGMLGISRDEAIGKHVEELFEEDFAETLQQLLGGEHWRLTELRNIYKLRTATRTGRALILNISLAPLQSEFPEQTGALVIVEDVTSRVRLEEQLQQREKLSSIGLLAAGVAHEVNTPLTGVSSYTQMLLGMLPETDPKHALLQKVRRQADRASDIVNN
ncbi:MAG: PAS domain S-box protein, partial [Pyrinomonadaceae bacterium]|nr:PAS domain S-box protein [Pyrinomonadaceae bacterium]